MNNLAKHEGPGRSSGADAGRRLQLQRTTSKAADKSVRPTRALHGGGTLSVTNEQPCKTRRPRWPSGADAGRHLQLQRTTSKAADKSVRPTRVLLRGGWRCG